MTAMASIIDIRGTHGSGKSWIVHQLLKEHGRTSVREDGAHLGCRLGRLNAVVLGNYGSTCGGCDQIDRADEVVRRVRLFASRYRYVILEGILVAHTFKRYNDLAEELEQEGHNYHFCFLDTPLETCIDRVLARRKERGQTKEFNPKHLKADYRTIWTNVRRHCTEAGRSVIVLPHEDPYTPILQLLRKR